MRHGDAGDAGVTYTDDAARKLTDIGKAKTRAMARALNAMKYEAPSIVISSPLVRAIETAEIVHDLFAPDAKRETTNAILPGSEMETSMAYLASMFKKHETVMLVGHEPHLSHFGSILIAGSYGGSIEMKKSAVAIITMSSLDVPRMRGLLRALLPPKLAHLDQ